MLELLPPPNTFWCSNKFTFARLLHPVAWDTALGYPYVENEVQGSRLPTHPVLGPRR